jgi:light-regulated signal transduction histidine kinase (bacteriophytochrome)
MNFAGLNCSLEKLHETVSLLQEELAKTNQEVLLLTLDLERRVENRTVELRIARDQLQETNLKLLELTVKLEQRVIERTRQLEQANDALRGEIKERKEAEAKLQAANEALRRANEDLRQFGYAAAHDMQEPLRNVANSLGLLKHVSKQAGEGEGGRLIDNSIEGAQYMVGMVKSLLAFTQIVDDPEARRELVDANEVIQRVLKNLNLSISEAGAQITCGRLPMVRIAPSHLGQVLQNLIDNALKYRSRNRTPCITISAVRQDAEWRFSVTDNGIGFDPAYAERIFGIFKRLHKKHEYPGTGIGLALCSRIISTYGGHIWAEAQPGAGATFQFTLADPEAHLNASTVERLNSHRG